MAELIVKCLCGIELTTSDDQAGATMQCPSCQQQFRVPGRVKPLPVAKPIPAAIPWTTETKRTAAPAPPKPPTYAPALQRSREETPGDKTLLIAITATGFLATGFIVLAMIWIAIERFDSDLNPADETTNPTSINVLDGSSTPIDDAWTRSAAKQDSDNTNAATAEDMTGSQ